MQCVIQVEVIANKLKLLLPTLIFDSQSVFVIRPQITDNILVTYVVIHFFRRKNKGNQCFIFLKLDISKAYDRVKWDYLECILMKLGFPTCIINLIMQYVKMASFSVLINGEPKGPIVSSRGLRKGDLLSSYLFLLCTERLVNLLR